MKGYVDILNNIESIYYTTGDIEFLWFLEGGREGCRNEREGLKK